MRWRVSRRGFWAAGLILGLAGLGGITWWWTRPADPGPPPRLVIAIPDNGTLEGFTADGRSVVVKSQAGLSAWNWLTGDPVPITAEAFIQLKVLSEDGESVAGFVRERSNNEAVVVADTATEAIRHRFALPTRHDVRRVEWIDDDRRIRAVVSGPNNFWSVVTWDLASGAETTRTIRVPDASAPWQALISPDGRTWAYMDWNRGRIQFWDVEADAPLGGILLSPNPAPTRVFGVWARSTFTPDGRTLLLGRVDGRIEVWDVASRRHLRTLQLHPEDHAVYALHVAPDGRTLASTAFSQPPVNGFEGFVEAVRSRLSSQSRVAERREAVVVDLASNQPLVRWFQSLCHGYVPGGQSVVTSEYEQKTLSIRDVPLPQRPAAPIVGGFAR